MPPRRDSRNQRRPWTAASDARAASAASRWADRRPAAEPTRAAPKSPRAQARYLRDEVYGGSTRRMAEAFGVRQRTVQRWIKGDRMPAEGERLARQVGETRQRRQAKRQAARSRPARVRAKGWIGPPLPPGPRRVGSPTTRQRTLTADLDAEQSEALAEAAERGDGDAVRELMADAFGDYFGDAGAADVGDLDWVEFS
jgi:hypothetical protein